MPQPEPTTAHRAPGPTGGLAPAVVASRRPWRRIGVWLPALVAAVSLAGFARPLAPVAAQDNQPPSAGQPNGGESNEEPAADDDDVPDRLRNVGVVGNPNTRDTYERGLDALRRAASAATDERRRVELAGAVDLLQRLLDDPATRRHLIQRHERGLFVGAAVSAQEALLRAGPEVLEAYRQRFDARAAEQLRFARINRRADRVEAVLLQFPFSTAAVPAGLEAARLAAERGDPLRAAALCERLLQREDLPQADTATLIAMAASCYAAAGRPFEAAQLQALAAARVPTARVALGDEWRMLDGVVREYVEAARAAADSPEVTRNWPMFGGNTAQNRPSGRPADAAGMRWQAQLPREVEQGETATFLLEYPSYDAPRRHAAIAGNLVIVPDRRHVVAFDLATGEVRWQHEQDARRGEFWRQATDQAVTYSATVDGDEVIVPQESPLQLRLHDPDGVDGHTNTFPGWPPICVKIHAPRRKLVALDLATGAVRWELGADRRDSELPVAETLSYPVPPVPVGDTLYCAGARVHDDNAHVYAVALRRPAAGDGETGKPTVAWVTRLASGQQETNLFGRPMREPTPSPPAVQAHRMFICTNLGLVVALDTLTGEPLWSVPYDRTDYSKEVSFTPIFRANTFVPQPPMVIGDRVVVAPHDASELLCYHAATGELLWKLPHRLAGQPVTYVVGAADGRLWLAASRRLLEVDVATGKLTRRPLELRGRRGTESVVGRPAVTDDAILIPLDDAILEVDRQSLTIRRTIRTGIGAATGNLVAADGVIVSVFEPHPTRAALAVAVTDDRLQPLQR